MKHDVERDPAGRVKGVRRRAAGDRPISATDPDMRHGRKSSSVLISGYKAHVSGTTGHGFIMATDVTGANVHDHAPLAMLVRKSRERGLEPPWVVGDRAYGTLANHTAFTADGATELVAPIIRPHNRGLFISDDFDIDLDARRATCPAKQTVDAREVRREGKSGWMFTFPASACGNCPLRDQCTRTAGPKGRSMFIVPAARRIVEARLDRQREPDYRERLAHRPTIERIIAGFGQCGGKRARRFGIEKVTFDVNLSALGYNLRRLARVVAQHPELRARLEAFLRLLVMLLIRRWVAVTFTQGRCRRDAAV